MVFESLTERRKKARNAMWASLLCLLGATLAKVAGLYRYAMTSTHSIASRVMWQVALLFLMWQVASLFLPSADVYDVLIAVAGCVPLVLSGYSVANTVQRRCILAQIAAPSPC